MSSSCDPALELCARWAFLVVLATVRGLLVAGKGFSPVLLVVRDPAVVAV
jgi:hypothetical protein